MAEVKYQREPTVSVHGVPKSEYEAGTAVPASGGGGGIVGSLKHHWMWWLIAAGILIVAYVIYVKYGNNQSTNAAIDPNTGLPVGATSPDQLWGSQLDADMQQIMSFQNQLLGQLNNQNPPTTTPPTTTPPPTNNPPPTNPPPQGGQPPAAPFHTDTVHGGDTLSGIASQTGFANWQALFNFGTNAQTIKSTAQAHGQWNPADPGHWIYPGEVLQVH